MFKSNVTFILLAAGTCLLAGCATGRGAAGEVILGIEVGRLVETTEQALIGAAGMIPGVGPLIQTLMLGVIGSGATVAGVSKVMMNKIEKRRRAADQEREETRVELAVAEAKIETLNGGS